MKNLSEVLVVVTGGAGLLGQAFVTALLEQGARVVIAEKDIMGADRFLSTMNQTRRKNCAAIEMDITSPSEVDAAIYEVKKRYGQINALVNNAYPRNQKYGADFFDVQYEDFCENISLNIGGYFLCCQRFAKYFTENGGGSIVNIASVYGVMAPKFEIYNNTSMTMPVEYAAIKSAIIHLTKYIAKYLKGSQVRVNSLSPGGIHDKQDARFLEAYNSLCLNKGMLSANDLIGALLFLLSPASKYINGQNITVDDGFTL